MEQFLRNFFNNDSVCLGLCDLQRKIAGVSFNNPPAHMQAYAQPTPQVYQQAYAQNYAQQQIQPQPQQRMSLSQYFAQQQREYAAKQAYASQKQTMVAPQVSKNPYAPQQRTFQQAMNQPQVQVQPQPQQRQVHVQQSSNVESYIQQRPTHSQPKTTTIINGNMKKVISAAVPARR